MGRAIPATELSMSKGGGMWPRAVCTSPLFITGSLYFPLSFTHFAHPNDALLVKGLAQGSYLGVVGFPLSPLSSPVVEHVLSILLYM